MSDRKIPIYFDCSIIDSPIQEISSGQGIGRLKVRAFTKYGNRNGSYITDAVADQLITSATNGSTPVVGFFDPETQEWASHTGPMLANGYGYVESFLGWEPFEDTDGVTREYAVFSVILFTQYFEEARKILGQNQSMELNPDSITGDWAEIDDEVYYVYKTAKMLGFCVIGNHEPCFSVSSFFSKADDTYNTQYEKFSSLLSDLKTRVEETEQGGEQPMNEFENEPVVVEEPAAEPEVTENQPAENFEQEEPVIEDQNIESVENEPNAEFEALQQQFNELQESYNELQTNYEALQTSMTEIQNNNQSLQEQNERLQARITSYEAREAETENARKAALIENYSGLVDGEEFEQIREQSNNYSYDELDGKLAVLFAHKQMKATEQVPLVQPEDPFAQFMKKYRKN